MTVNVFRLSLDEGLNQVRQAIEKKRAQLADLREELTKDEEILQGLIQAEADFVAGIAVIDAHAAEVAA